MSTATRANATDQRSPCVRNVRLGSNTNGKLRRARSEPTFDRA
jgi:hypothetical protein